MKELFGIVCLGVFYALLFLWEGFAFAIFINAIKPGSFVSLIIGGLMAYIGFRGIRFLWKYKKRMKFIDNYQFPDGVDEKILYTYPHLSDQDLNYIKKNLKHFFKIWMASGRFKSTIVAMPSQVVDIAWHEFILHTKDYHNFCDHVFGRYFHHNTFSKKIESNDIKSSLECAWSLSCMEENIDKYDPHCLPTLFSIDSTLNIPDGNEFSIEKTEVSNGTFKCVRGSFSELGEVTFVKPKETGGGGGCGGGCGGG